MVKQKKYQINQLKLKAHNKYKKSVIDRSQYIQDRMYKIDKFGYEYTLKKYLGRGTFGQVKLYERINQITPTPFNDFFYHQKINNNKYCAIKCYLERLSNNQGLSCSTLRQLNLMLTCNHSNIVCAHQAFYHREKIQVVMDFYLDLPLIIHEQSIMSKQENKIFICLQITQGLAFLHQNYFIHRDLKPQNIFISREGVIKIGDFGLSKQYGTPNKKFTPYVCTRDYRAPELFMNTNYYTFKIDIWSLGCIYYYVYTGKILFPAQNKTELTLIRDIFAITGTPDENCWKGYKLLPKVFEFQPYQKKSIAKEKGLPEDISLLIQQCINLDPKKRPTTKQLLNSEYFKKFKKNTNIQSLNIQQLYDNKLQNILNKT